MINLFLLKFHRTELPGRGEWYGWGLGVGDVVMHHCDWGLQPHHYAMVMVVMMMMMAVLHGDGGHLR